MESTLALALLGGGLTIVGGVCAALILRRRAQRRNRPRVVEAPNSHYHSRGVQNLVDRERWEGIRIDRLHEINADEVRALLARVRENGVRGLSPSDRAFLDRMVTAVGTVGPEKPPRAEFGPTPGPVTPPPQPG
jgi:hypothetical protein